MPKIDLWDELQISQSRFENAASLVYLQGAMQPHVDLLANRHKDHRSLHCHRQELQFYHHARKSLAVKVQTDHQRM